MVIAALAPNEKVPPPPIVCSAVPLKIIADALAGVKESVWLVATETLPLIVMPPVRLKPAVPAVTVRLSTLSALAPTMFAWEKLAELISRLA